MSRLDPNESLGIKINQHREQYHDSAEENTEQSASSGVTAPSEPAETPPVRVYVPKVPYPIPSKHLMDPISAEQLAGFRKMVKKVMDGDPHTDTKKLSGNAKANEKVQKKRVKGDPMMILIPRLCDEKSIEYEVKCKGATAPGGDLAMEHPEFSWSVRSTQGATDPKPMNCARAGVENQNGCEIRTTSGTQNHHVLPPSPSHHQKTKNENKVMEKGKKSKKHEPLGRSSKKFVPSIEESGVALDGRCTSWIKRCIKECNLEIFTRNNLSDCSR
ncbi:hypothetical protein F2Q69_00059774 [Brassica cretica]|uniref:Uncharacterized protein n=1 Tax=Brassica cretica TaxID=69181 RepID=A0A8S9RBR5_BRACR|nr:hypothetical protein F2Q69_00059774 [Brassica cretica]